MENIWGPLITAIASVVVFLLSWMVGRQEKTDTRAIIVRDLEILEKLDPTNSAHEKLKDDIDDRISTLVKSRSSKSGSQTLFQIYLLFAGLVVLIFGTRWLSGQEWIGSGAWSLAVTVSLWVFIILMLITLVGMFITAIKLVPSSWGK